MKSYNNAAIKDMRLYSNAIIAEDIAAAQAILDKYGISHIMPERIVQAGLLAAVEGKDVHRCMNDIMDSLDLWDEIPLRRNK